ncbi:MAG TPA: hypothetical protein VN930_03245 [Xanthobacteraceae bacterium]|jgi:hypothetical protein|nr:hypothetical protein [Xanthobacteraceae bacterium]
MASALPATVRNSVSICERNETIAASIAVRRLCCTSISSRCFSRSCSSVMSSWVTTQPPPGIGVFTA